MGDLAMDLFCHEVLDFFDEPVPKLQKISYPNVEYLSITANDMEIFFALLENLRIRTFLEYDKFFQYADKYLIAMVMTYFKRAGYSYKEYNIYNFFVALHLAHDMEEDEEELKYMLIRWMFRTKWEEKHDDFLISRDKLWMSINYRGVVSKKCCEEVISMLPEHPVWKRQRLEEYGGAKRILVENWDIESPENIETIFYNDSCCDSIQCGPENVLLLDVDFNDTEKKKSHLIDGFEGCENQKREDGLPSKGVCLRLNDKIKVKFHIHEE